MISENTKKEGRSLEMRTVFSPWLSHAIIITTQPASSFSSLILPVFHGDKVLIHIFKKLEDLCF